MIKKINIQEFETADQVYKLQQIAYTIESQKINFNGIPYLHETLSELMKSPENFYAYFQGDRIAGVFSYLYENKIIDGHRMMVHPDFFRQGIANHLLHFTETLHPEASSFIIQTGFKNEPAKALYLKNNFNITGTIQINPQVQLVSFEKHYSPPNGSE